MGNENKMNRVRQETQTAQVNNHIQNSSIKLAHTNINSIRNKGSLTIWPIYAYTLAAWNSVIKLLTLIFYTEDNSSMYYEGICVQIFTYSIII